MISLSTERGIVLALACLIYKHYINITPLSFTPQETVLSTVLWRGLTGKEPDKRRVEERVSRC